MKVEFDKAWKENNVSKKLVLNVFVGDFLLGDLKFLAMDDFRKLC